MPSLSLNFSGIIIENPELEKYDIQNNKGYGTKKHLDAIRKYGMKNRDKTGGSWAIVPTNMT